MVLLPWSSVSPLGHSMLEVTKMRRLEPSIQAFSMRPMLSLTSSSSQSVQYIQLPGQARAQPLERQSLSIKIPPIPRHFRSMDSVDSKPKKYEGLRFEWDSRCGRCCCPGFDGKVAQRHTTHEKPSSRHFSKPCFSTTLARAIWAELLKINKEITKNWNRHFPHVNTNTQTSPAIKSKWNAALIKLFRRRTPLNCCLTAHQGRKE